MERLQEIYNTNGLEKLTDAIESSLLQKNYDSIYLLYNKKTNQIIAGNLIGIPHFTRDGWHILDLSELSNDPQQQNHSARILIMSLPEKLILINGLDIESAHQQEHMIFNSLIAGIAIIILLGTIGGFIISISTIKKINLINNTINDIGDGNLTLRIPLRGSDDDYDLLAQNINQMLDQIHKLMQGMQNISNSIAHDLRTPLTRLRGHLERVQQHCSDKTFARIQDALKETDDLLSTFNAILRINKLESGVQKGHFTRLSIEKLLKDIIEFYQPLADDKEITLSLHIAENYYLYADKDMIFQVFVNVLDNAIKYTPRQGNISLTAIKIIQNNIEQIQIIIADSGIGIPENERKKVLELFYRLEKHRDHQGNGLGLSLVTAIVKLHKGTVDLQDNLPGLKVCISLPVQH
jgi:signal transduction histidine kinase